jgi:hypothetical protein
MKIELKEKDVMAVLLGDTEDEEALQELDNIVYGLDQLQSRFTGTPVKKQMRELLAFFSTLSGAYRDACEQDAQDKPWRNT